MEHTITHTDHDGHEYFLACLPVSELTVLKNFQRTERSSKIEMIARNFHEDRVGAMIVAQLQSETGNTIYHVCDGQHRLFAIRKLIENNKIDADIKVPCVVYTNLNSNECFDITIDYNKVRATLPANDLFTMRLAQNNPFIVFIDKIVKEHGFTTKKESRTRVCDYIMGSNMMHPYAGLNRKTNNPDECFYKEDQTVTPYVHMTLRLLSHLWEKDKVFGNSEKIPSGIFRTNTNIIKGFFYFFKAYGKYIIKEGISEKELVNVFEHTTPEQLLQFGRRLKNLNLDDGATDSGFNLNQERTRRLMILGVLMMIYNYDFGMAPGHGFSPNGKAEKAGKMKKSDWSYIENIESLQKESKLDSADFVLKGKVRKFKRTPGYGYGYEYFNHKEESQNE